LQVHFANFDYIRHILKKQFLQENGLTDMDNLQTAMCGLM